MNIQQTLSIIKPDAVERNIVGKILSKLESSGLKIIAQKKIQLTEHQAKEFLNLNSLILKVSYLLYFSLLHLV
jgi:nucleoside-diphosphate kinase